MMIPIQRAYFLLVTLLYFSFVALAQPVPVTKTNAAKVYMHYMPWFDGPLNPVPGSDYTWGYHWKMSNRNPNLIDSKTGKRQIASHFYPLIGPYASVDPAVIEYHLLLMKLSGIDGVLLDWYGTQGSNGDVSSLLTNSNVLINFTDDVGLDFGLIIEDRFWASRSVASTNIIYAKNNYFGKPNYIRIGDGNDPLVGIFGPITLQTEADWTEILSNAGEDIAFLTLWYESTDAGSNADGEYEWIYNDYLTGLTNFYSNRIVQLENAGKHIAGGIAYPGFKDFYAQGGAGQSLFTIEHNNGATLNETLNKFTQYSDKVDFLQLATFNDYGEGTMFEPTYEFGFKYLAKIQEFTGVPYTEQDLRNVYRLFVLRKKYSGNASKTSALNAVFSHFIKHEIDQAVAGMDALDDAVNSEVTSLPGFMQAESYGAKHGQILTEPVIDAGGGSDVTWIDASDSLDYSVSVSKTETYNINYRVSNYSQGGKLILKKNNIAIDTINIPVTNGWQTWTTVSSSVNLDEGAQTLRLVGLEGSFAVNWIQFISTTPVAIEHSNPEFSTELWPTVVERYLNIHSNKPIDHVNITDVLGRGRYFIEPESTQNLVLDLQHLEPGVHFVQIHSNSNTKVVRILKR
jgi:hypothetical protein